MNDNWSEDALKPIIEQGRKQYAASKEQEERSQAETKNLVAISTTVEDDPSAGVARAKIFEKQHAEHSVE